MNSQVVTIQKLFDEKQRHLVPLFQRRYVWKQDKQWEPLWADISTKADGIAASLSNKGPVTPHFLGAVVLGSPVAELFRVTWVDIIDGQQRLTTLQIILSALRDLVATIEPVDQNLGKKLEDLTRNISDHDDESLKVWPTNQDREVFRKVMTEGAETRLQALYPQKKKKYSRQMEERHPLVEAYFYFYKQMLEFINDVEHNLDRSTLLNILSETITKHLQLVVIQLAESDSPQVIFETLNGRGAALDASDLIRNFIFMRAAETGESSEELYTHYWSEFDQPLQGRDSNFWKMKERQGRLLRPRLDLLIFHFLTLKALTDVAVTDLYSAFKQYWKVAGITRVEDFAQEFVKYAEVFKRILSNSGSTRFDSFLRRLRQMDTSTVYPLLLYLLTTPGISDQELDNIAVDLESYLIRRYVCGLTTKNYNNYFLSMVKAVQATDELPSAVIRRTLLEGTGSAVRWPDDKEFLDGFLNQPLYEISIPRTEMILQAIETCLVSNKSEALAENQKFSIEHIFPQTPAKGEWPDLAQEDELKIHTLGNLTLLTGPLNSSLKNGAFHKKRQEINNHSRLTLNKYFQNTDDTWDVLQIKQRAQDLFKTAREFWLHPDGTVIGN